MGVVTGLTAARMLAIEAASIVSGVVNGSGRLILTKYSGATIDAGNVVGPQGTNGTNGTNGTTAPTGGMIQWPAAAAPSGWLLCQGQELAIATYGDLYAVVGVIYGALTNGSGGAGTTHFRVPNLKGRVPVGLDSGQTEFDALGETGGAKTHTLTTAQTPSHSHGGATPSGGAVDHYHQAGSDPGAFHLHRSKTVSMYAAASGGGPWTLHTLSAGGTQNDVVDLAGNHTHTAGASDRSLAHAHTINAEGGGTSHPILSPYIVLNYIIKT